MPRPKFQQPAEGSAIDGGQETGGEVGEPKSEPKRSAPNPEIGAIAGKPVETPEEPSPVQAAELTAQLEAALADSGSGEPEAEQLAGEALEDIGEPEQNIERREARASQNQPWRSVKTSEATARLGSLPFRPSRAHTQDTLSVGKFIGDALIIGIPAGLLIWGATFVLSPLWLAPAVVLISLAAFSGIILRLLKYFK